MKTKALIAFLLILVMMAGAAAGIFLVQRRQNLDQEAAVPSGTAEIGLSPSAYTASAGETFDVNLVFSTSGQVVSGATALLTFPATPGLTVSEVLRNDTLVNDYQWRYAQIVSDVTPEGTVRIQVIANTTGVEGYQSSTDTTLATIRFTASSQASASLRFDNALTTITSKTTGADILAIPENPAGVYNVSGAPLPSATPTPPPANNNGVCNLTCSSSADCSGGLTCYQNQCRNSTCPAEGDCDCTAAPTSTPAPAGPTSTPAPTLAPNPDALPTAGTPAPTLMVMALGLFLVSGGFLAYRRLG